jgi:hypothetical protein
VTGPPAIRLRLDKNQPGPLIPSALEIYRALPTDGGENGKRIKSVLERLRSEPGKVRGESLRYRPDGWIVLVEMEDESTWWTIWRQPSPDTVDVLWIGPQPGPDPLAYSTQTQLP